MRFSVEDYLERERDKEELGDFTLSEYNEKGTLSLSLCNVLCTAAELFKLVLYSLKNQFKLSFTSPLHNKIIYYTLILLHHFIYILFIISNAYYRFFYLHSATVRISYGKKTIIKHVFQY